MPVAAVDPKEVGGVEGVDEGGVEHELGLQVVQEVVSVGWLRWVVAVTQCRRGERKQ